MMWFLGDYMFLPFLIRPSPGRKFFVEGLYKPYTFLKKEFTT